MEKNFRKVAFFAMLGLFVVGVGYVNGDLASSLGVDLASQLKKLLKDPLLNLLSCSEFTESAVVKTRLADAEKAVSDFKTALEQKVVTTPAVASTTVTPVAVPEAVVTTTAPAATVTPDAPVAAAEEPVMVDAPVEEVAAPAETTAPDASTSIPAVEATAVVVPAPVVPVVPAVIATSVAVPAAAPAPATMPVAS